MADDYCKSSGEKPKLSALSTQCHALLLLVIALKTNDKFQALQSALFEPPLAERTSMQSVLFGLLSHAEFASQISDALFDALNGHTSERN